MERSNLALTMPAQVNTIVAPKEPTFNMEGLPDPVINPKAYGEELAKRMASYNGELQAFHTAKQTAAPQGGNYDVLWEDFATANPSYADDQEGIEFATAKVIKNMQRRGVDTNRYMFQQSDRFFRDIVGAYNERFGKPGEDVLEEPKTRRAPVQGDATGTGRRPEEEGDIEPNRTGGIFGGVDGSSSGRTPRAPVAGDMIKDLHDLQRKSGYWG
jgi:hypothetical protein